MCPFDKLFLSPFDERSRVVNYGLDGMLHVDVDVVRWWHQRMLGKHGLQDCFAWLKLSVIYRVNSASFRL